MHLTYLAPGAQNYSQDTVGQDTQGNSVALGDERIFKMGRQRFLQEAALSLGP